VEGSLDANARSAPARDRGTESGRLKMRKKQTASISLPPFKYAGSKPRDTDPTASAERLLAVGEVARLLHVSRGTVYKLIRIGDLPALRVGRSLRLRVRSVQRYLARRSEPVCRRAS
jgi:excisionase family DNA binding protein